MKNLITKSVWLVLIGLVLSTQSLSQVIATQFRYVSPENTEEFIKRETTYWSEVAREAIKQGKMVKWILWQKVGGWQLDERPNFLFVNIYANKEGLDKQNEVWGLTSEVFPDKDVSEYETGSLSTTKHAIYWQGGPSVGDQQAQFIRVNYVKTTGGVGTYIQLEDSLWKPFITEQMKAGKVKQTSWSAASVLIPTGANMPFNAVTVDGYQTLSEAVSPSFGDDVDFPDLTALNEVHDKVFIQTYRLVKAVEAEGE